MNIIKYPKTLYLSGSTLKINKLIIITVLTTVLMSVNAFAETVRAIKLNLTYDGKTVEYREKEVKVWGLKDITVDQANIGLKGSPTRVFQTFTKSLKAAGTVVQLDAEESAEYMLEKLKEKFII
mgnify:CR=1 FL=1